MAATDDTTAAAQAVAEELVKARMLAAEREHELVELRSRLQRYEDEIINLPQDEEDELDMEATELWLSGNTHISEGNVAEGVSAYTSSMSSLLRRFQDLKSRVQARDLVHMEVKQKWMADKDNELQLVRNEFQAQLKQHDLALQQREEWIEAKQQEFSQERMRWEEAQEALHTEFAQERESLLTQERSQWEERMGKIEESMCAKFAQERETLLAAAQQELSKERLQWEERVSKAEESVRGEFAQERETLLAAAQQELSQERSRLEDSLSKVEENLRGEFAQERENLVASAAVAQQQLEDTKNKLQLHEEQTAQLLKKYQALKEEHKTLKRQVEVQRNDYKTQVAQLEADSLTRQEQLNLARENCDKAQNESIELTNQVFELEAELAQCKVQYASMESRIASDEAELVQLRHQLASTAQQIASDEAELARLRHQLASTVAQMEQTSKEEFDLLQQEVSSSALALQALQFEIASQVAVKQAELDEAHRAYNAIVDEHTGKLEAQLQRSDILQHELERKTEQLTQAQNENIELNDQVFELQAEQQQMVKANSELQSEMSTALMENQTLRSRIAADTTTEVLQWQVEQLQCEVNELRFQAEMFHLCNETQMDLVKSQAKERVEKIQREAKARMNKTRQEAAALVEKTKAEHEQELLALRTNYDDNSQTKAQLSALQGENSTLTQQVNKLEVNKSTLNEQLAALQGDKSALTQQLESLQSDKSTLVAQVATLQTDKSTLTEQLSKVEADKSTLTEQIGKLEVDSGSQVAALAVAQAEIVSLTQQCNALQAELATCKQALASETLTLNQLNAELASKQAASAAQLAHAQQQVEQIQLAHNELELKLESLLQESIVEQAKWKQSVEVLQNENISLNDQIFELQAEAANKPVDDAQFLELSRQVFELQSEVSSLRNTIIELKQEIDVLQSANAKSRDDAHAAKQAELRLESEAQRLEQLTSELMLDLQGLQLMLDQAQEKIQIVDQDKRLCEIAIDNLHTKLEQQVKQQQQPPPSTRRGLNLVSNEARIYELEAVLRTASEQNAYLEQELKRNRHEFQFNTQNLQSECEALRRRLEELGLAEESRNRSGSLDQGSARKKPPHLRHTTFLLPHYQETPESQGRMRPRRNSMLELRASGDLEVDPAPGALSELKRARQEFALATKNLQSECEALRRRVEELELELEAKSELLQSYPATITTAVAPLTKPSFVRSFSEVESQRSNGGGNAWLPLETPESRRLYDTSTSSASPVAFRLDVDEEEEEKTVKPTVTAPMEAVSEEVIGLRSKIAELEAVLVELEADRDYRVAQVEEELAAVKKELEAAVAVQHQPQEVKADEDEDKEVERLEMRVRELESQIPRSDEVAVALQKLLVLKQRWQGAIGQRFVELEQQASALVCAVQALELQRNAVQDQLKAAFGAEDDEEPAADEPNAALKIAQELASALTLAPQPDADVEVVINEVRACLLPSTTTASSTGGEDWAKTAKQLEKEKRELVNRLRRSEAELASRVEFFSHSNLYAQPQYQLNDVSSSVVMQTPTRDSNNVSAEEQDRSRLDVTPWKNAAYSNSTAASKRSDWSAMSSSKPAAAWSYDDQQQQQEHPYEDWQQQQPQQEDWQQQQQGWEQQEDWQQPQEQQEWSQQEEPQWKAEPQQQDTQWQAKPPQQQDEQATAVVQEKMANRRDKKSGPSVLAKAFGIGSYHPEWKPDPKELDEDNSDFEETTADANVATLPASTPESGEEWFQPPPVQEYEPRGSWQGDVTTEEIWGGDGDTAAAASAVQDWNNNNEQWIENQTWQDADVTPPVEQQEWQQQSEEQQQQWQEGPVTTADYGYVEQTPQKAAVQVVNENVHWNGEDELLAKRIHELKEELSLEREARLLRESQCESFESTLSLVRRDAEILKAELYSMESKHQEEIESLAAQLEYAKQQQPQSSSLAVLHNDYDEDFQHHNNEDVIVYTSTIQQDTMTLVVNRDKETAALEAKLGDALETIHALRHQISQLELVPQQQVQKERNVDEDTVHLQEQIKLRENDVAHLVSQLSRVTYDLLSAEEQAKRTSPVTTASFAIVAFALSALIPPQAIAQRVVQMFQMV